jgi:enterochelin esterase-like enzyme
LKFPHNFLSLSLILLIIFLFQAPDFLFSQENKQQRVGPPSWTMANSPEIHSDGTVSFRIWAPEAGEVKMESELLEGQYSLLTKGDNNIWSIQVTPSKAGLFKYRFLVDDVITVDPTNDITDATWNLIFIKGDEADFYTVKEVPHGVIHQHFYHSKYLNSERPFHIYTPPDYYSNSQKKYPVLFLLHGSGGTDASWIKMGKANVILDNLVAAGKAKSMIVILPYGHTVEPGTSGWPFVREKGDFIKDFFDELLPVAEKLYRISNQPKDRAIAGFSMGGYHSLKIGLNHLDQFDYVGIFSWGAGRKWLAENAPQTIINPENVNLNLKLLWIACGKNDFLFKNVQDLDETLTELDINHTFVVNDGGHSMINWRHYLYQFAQLLFKE